MDAQPKARPIVGAAQRPVVYLFIFVVVTVLVVASLIRVVRELLYQFVVCLENGLPPVARAVGRGSVMNEV